MKIVGINGSPRKGWNSDTLLNYALEGAKSAGNQIVKYNLFDVKFSGCISCFGCKRLGNKDFCRCNLKDELTGILDEILLADGLIVAAPIYCWETPGAVRNFYERLIYPGNDYTPNCVSAYEKRINVALIYTMNAPDSKCNYYTAERDKLIFDRFIGPTTIFNVTETNQFDDYSKYASSKMNPVERKIRHETVFKEDCNKAFDLGKGLC